MKNKLLLFLIPAILLLNSCTVNVEERCESYVELSEECRAAANAEKTNVLTTIKECEMEAAKKVGFDGINQEALAACKKKMQPQQAIRTVEEEMQNLPQLNGVPIPKESYGK